MSEQPSQLQQMKPYLIAAGALLVLLIIVVFWPTEDKSADVEVVPEVQMPETTNVETTPVDVLPDIETDVVDESVYEGLPETKEVVIGSDDADTPVQEVPPIVEVPVEIPEVMVTDEMITTALQTAIEAPAFARLLVDDGLIQRFVINVNNLANEEASPKDALVVAPQQSFRVYEQADSEWIDPASYQRYTPYVDVLESADTERLVALLDEFRPTLEERFAEIARPGQSLDQTLIEAINVLLDTPQVPVPIEVYSDSVMYKFKDERLEALPLPQKQLIRMGPDNMRRLKAVLRDIKAELE